MYGYPTPAQAVWAYVQTLSRDAGFLLLLPATMAEAFGPQTVVKIISAMYTEGYLKTLVWTCISNVGWWQLTEFMVNMITWLAPGIGQAALIARIVVLVLQLLLQVNGATYPPTVSYSTACGQGEYPDVNNIVLYLPTPAHNA